MNSKRAILAAGLAVLMAAGAASAELGYEGWGVRGGFRFDGPDQFVVGYHADLGEITEGLRLVPMADIGFGDNITLVTVNADVQYHLADVQLGNLGGLYLLGGLGFLYYKLDFGDACDGLVGAAQNNCEDAFDDTHTDIAFNLGAGVQNENGIFGEFRMTFEDGSFFQAAVGKTFGR